MKTQQDDAALVKIGQISILLNEIIDLVPGATYEQIMNFAIGYAKTKKNKRK